MAQARAQGAGDDTGAQGSGEPDIIPRDIHFGISANATRNWNGGDPIKTMMIDGLSIFLPEGERFFIRSLKHYAASAGDAQLAREINGYAVQEAFHTREHEDYNRALAALGYDVAKMEQPIRATLGTAKQPLIRLAVTCAIEHLTATLSSSTLRHPEAFAEAHPDYRRLWMWHALEELEHKAVALHVFKAATANMPRWQRYGLRVMAMNSTIVPFLVIYLRNTALYARRDGIGTGPRFWLRFAHALFVKPGLWTASLWSFLRYYRPGFDPHNADDAQLIGRTRTWLADELAQPAAAQ